MQHTASENLGTIEYALRGHQIEFAYIETHRAKAVPPEMADKAGLVVMGGPMGVYEEAAFPFLRDEMRLIESALALGHPVLGVCLGSQLLAAVLGAEVTKGPRKELGWYEVVLTESGRSDSLFANVQPSFWPFHWHGDVFSLPKGSVSLASSQQTAHQAFRHGKNAYGLLFHLEVTKPQIAEMLNVFVDELREAGASSAEIAEQTPRHLTALQAIASDVFNRWAAML